MDDQRNNAELLAQAHSHMFTFGGDFLPNVVVRTSGLCYYTASGRTILDWTSGQMSCLLGHGHPEIVETIRTHAASLDHLYSGMLSPPVIDLACKLTEALGPGLDKAMFLSTGGESNECAIRMAKVFTGKFEIVGLSSSWHGVTAGANGAQYHAGRKGFGPTVRTISAIWNSYTTAANCARGAWYAHAADARLLPFHLPPPRRQS